jgi:uncharacterized protein YbjT (DUF2867 family)
MKVLIFGATGMVGQGVLRECLLAEDVSSVCVVGRTATSLQHAKLTEVIHPDMFDLENIRVQLQGFDACFFCLGISSSGMTEAAYSRITYDLTLSVAGVLAALNPLMTFVYVSGAGTDPGGRGSSMWARVKGRTENALQSLPFKAIFLFRPGLIQPLNGIRSKTPLYQRLLTLTKPILPLLRWLFPRQVLTTEIVGRAMLAVARQGTTKPVLEPWDIAALGRP